MMAFKVPDLENHAKALVALAAGALAPALLAAALLLLGFDPGFSVLGLSAFTGTFTATAVWWVPNKTHGYNVNDIAAVLIQAGFDAVEKDKD